MTVQTPIDRTYYCPAKNWISNLPEEYKDKTITMILQISGEMSFIKKQIGNDAFILDKIVIRNGNTTETYEISGTPFYENGQKVNINIEKNITNKKIFIICP